MNNVPNINKFGAAKRSSIKNAGIRGGPREGGLFWQILWKLFMLMAQDKFDHNKGQKSAISGRRLHWRLSTGFFAFSPVFMCNLVRRAP